MKKNSDNTKTEVNLNNNSNHRSGYNRFMHIYGHLKSYKNNNILQPKPEEKNKGSWTSKVNPEIYELVKLHDNEETYKFYKDSLLLMPDKMKQGLFGTTDDKDPKMIKGIEALYTKECLANEKNDGLGIFAIVRKSDRHKCGFYVLKNFKKLETEETSVYEKLIKIFKPNDDAIEVSFRILPSDQRKYVLSSTIYPYYDMAFKKNKNCNTLVCRSMENEGQDSVITKTGMRKIGIQSQNNIDLYTSVITKEEFLKNKAILQPHFNTK